MNGVNVSVEKAPTILTEVGARRLTARIRDALALADDLLVQAYEGRAWAALGHDSWEAYCRAELPELRHLRLRQEARRQRVAKLHAKGASQREIVAATGAGLGTINGDVAVITGRATPSGPEVRAEVKERLSNWARAVAHVAAQGSRGLTCLELEQETGWGHGAASAALHRAEKLGHLARVTVYRRGYAAYTLREEVRP